MDGYAIGDGRHCCILEPSEVVACHRTATATAAPSPLFLIRVEAHPRHPWGMSGGLTERRPPRTPPSPAPMPAPSVTCPRWSAGPGWASSAGHELRRHRFGGPGSTLSPD